MMAPLTASMGQTMGQKHGVSEQQRKTEDQLQEQDVVKKRAQSQAQQMSSTFFKILF